MLPSFLLEQVRSRIKLLISVSKQSSEYKKNFNVNKKKYIMNKILILYEPLASWCLSLCQKNPRCVYPAAPYLSSALSVAPCLDFCAPSIPR